MKDDIRKHLKYTSDEDLLDWCVNWSDAIIHDEFNRKDPRFGEKLPPYRERAIDRIVEMRINWNSNGNISHEVARRYLIIKCPYCEENMEFNGSTSRMYLCKKCKATANPTVEIYFNAPPK